MHNICGIQNTSVIMKQDVKGRVYYKHTNIVTPKSNIQKQTWYCMMNAGYQLNMDETSTDGF